ncbi:MAG: hypothetical protein Q9187_009143, partial [Circinaria calcarea]
MDVASCITAYSELSELVFKEESWWLPFSLLTGQVKPRYSASVLESAVKTIIRDQGLPEDALLIEEIEPRCKVFVCAVRGATRNGTRLPSYYTSRNANDSRIAIWQAARATSAASGFFEPIKIGQDGEEYLDGATHANNPVNELWNSIRDDSPTPHPEDNIKCLVSIGTGIPTLRAFGKSLKELGVTLIAMATESQKTAQTFQQAHSELEKSQRYYRFNVPGGLNDVGLDEVKKKDTIVAATKDYLEGEAFNHLADCARQLLAAEAPQYQVTVSRSPQEIAALKCLTGSDLEELEDRIPKRVPGTCEWLTGHRKMVNWISSTSPGLVWVSGNPGCGKTVLAASLVDKLRDQKSRAMICYFFFRDDNEKQRSARNCLLALLYQLLSAREAASVLTRVVTGIESEGKEFSDAVRSVSSCWKLFTECIEYLDCANVFCVVDALDECDDWMSLAEELEKFYSKGLKQGENPALK